jgi:hypothetical protein
MSPQAEAALIAGVVSLLTASLTGVLTLMEVRRERTKWVSELTTSHALEVHRQRLAAYPEAFRILRGVSHPAVPGAAEAARVAVELNDWIYSAGGMCAEAGTRGAIIGLRNSCRKWQKTGEKPGDLYAWRNAALAMLRLDLDLEGLEDYDLAKPQTVLERLQRQIAAAEKRGKVAARQAVSRKAVRF